MTSRSRSVNRFAVVRFVRPVLLALCSVSCVFHVSRCLISPRISLVCSCSVIIAIHPVVTVCCPFFLLAIHARLTVRFRGWIFPCRLTVVARLAQCLVIPLRPEENITAAIDGNDVIHHKSWRINPLSQTTHA